MQNTNYEHEPAELHDVLKAWQAPAVPAGLDQRVLASYRQHIHRPSFWQRFCTASIRIPAPLAAAAGLLLLAAGVVVLTALPRTAPQSLPLAQNAPKPDIIPTIIKVPVVQERIVTRTVYVEKPAPTARLPVRPQPPLPPGNQALKVASHVLGDNAYTDVDLSGYQPVEEMKVRIIKGSTPNDE